MVPLSPIGPLDQDNVADGMTNDPIIEELHRQRAEEMERLGFDFEAFYRKVKEEERRSSEPVLHPPRQEER